MFLSLYVLKRLYLSTNNGCNIHGSETKNKAMEA